MPTTIHRPMQHPILPWEITDTIIDHLHSDIQTLGSCSAVCSEWLFRSRFHLFSTVQLWPWRIQRFFDLANESLCTFVDQIRCIEVDDSQAVDIVGRKRTVELANGGANKSLFIDAMAQSSYIPSLGHVRSIRVYNADWTKLSLTEQATLRSDLGRFTQLQRLELHGAVFHDMREVVRIAEALPALYHLTANVTFMKHLEHTISSAMANRPLPRNLRSVELGTDDAIPVVLSSLAGRDDPHFAHILELKLKEIKYEHLRYIQTAIGKNGRDLQHVSLGFALDKVSADEIIKTLDFSHLSHLQTLHIVGLTPTKDPSSFEDPLSKVLRSIESSFLESVQFQLYLEDTTSMTNDRWCSLEREWLALHFFGMKFASIVVDIPSESSTTEGEVEAWIRDSMNDLHSRGALRVSVVRERVVEDAESCAGDTSKD